MMVPKNAFGMRLKEAFDNATNAQIAEKIGVAEGTVGFYVRGRVPDAELLVKIANVTNRSIDWLLTGKKEPSKGRIFEKQIEDPLINRDALKDMVRQVVREELKMQVQDLGTADEFDVAAAVIEYNDPHRVMRDWLAFERREYSDDYGVQFFKGWDSYSLEEKIDAVRDAKAALERTQKK